MTTFLLIRHAAHDLVGKALAGRQPGVLLNSAGLLEAQELEDRLTHAKLDAIYVSPRERTQQTAAPLALARNLPLQVEPALDDIDFGSWTGRSFAELASDPQWPIWCQRRTAAQPPNGERITGVQARIVAALQNLAAAHPEQTVAIVGHCDVIKCALAHHLAIALDDLERFDISPSSLTVLLMGEGWSKVTLVNGLGVWPAAK